ncbi:MAG: hypothetical protein KDC51_10095 [Flavobacteriaceae bacterium]|nr:hypothetical protein [Flavobacteriaceae bacterium]HPF96736.1 hypothetical protein [Mangrovimonas sp.]
MKAVLHYRVLAFLLIAPLLAFSNAPTKDKHEKQKTIKKEFNVSSNAQVEIDNSYGNLDIVTWNENRVVFEITIKTSGNNEDKVAERLEEITVEFNASSNHVSAKTIFNKNKSSNWWNWGKNNNVNMQVNYIVKMPMSNSVNLSNDYGSINLGKLEGKATISCDYGKITTEELMAEGNVLNFDYTSSCYFEYINTGSINADYSGYTVGKAKNLNISADYTQSKIEVAEDVKFNCDYGGITIEKANNIMGNGDYLTTRIGEVYKNLTLESDYGSIKVDRMTSNAGNIKIDSDYTGIKIGIAKDYSFSFDIDLEYASLNDTSGFEYKTKIIDSSDKKYTGYHGNSGSGNSVRISSDYGSVTFFEN